MTITIGSATVDTFQGSTTPANAYQSRSAPYTPDGNAADLNLEWVCRTFSQSATVRSDVAVDAITLTVADVEF